MENLFLPDIWTSPCTDQSGRTPWPEDIKRGSQAATQKKGVGTFLRVKWNDIPFESIPSMYKRTTTSQYKSYKKQRVTLLCKAKAKVMACTAT